MKSHEARRPTLEKLGKSGQEFKVPKEDFMTQFSKVIEQSPKTDAPKKEIIRLLEAQTTIDQQLAALPIKEGSPKEIVQLYVFMGWLCSIIEAHSQLLQAARDYYTDKNHPIEKLPHKKRKKLSIEEQMTMTIEWKNFPTLVKAVRPAIASQIPGWLPDQPTAKDEYLDEIEAPPLIYTLFDYAQRFVNPSKKSLTNSEYNQLLDLLLNLLPQKGDQINNIGLFLCQCCVIEPESEFDSLDIHHGLKGYAKKGAQVIDLIRLLIHKMSVVLIDVEDPLHEKSLQLVQQLNEILPPPTTVNPIEKEIISQAPFWYQLAINMILRDVDNKFNYHNFVLAIQHLTNNPDNRNLEWFAQYLEYLLKINRTLPFKLVLFAQEFRDHVFSPQENSQPNPQQINLDYLAAIHRKYGDGVQFHLSDEKNPSFSMQGDVDTVLSIRKYAERVYIIDGSIQVHKNTNDDKKVELIKARFQIQIDDRQVKVIPALIDHETIEEDVLTAISNHVAVCVDKIYQEKQSEIINQASRKSTSQTQAKLNSSGKGPKDSRKRRPERMSEYASYKRDQVHADQMDAEEEDEQPIGIAAHAKEEEFIHRFLPNTLTIHPDLATDARKGRLRHLIGQLESFVTDYNQATSNKPGKGALLAGVREYEGQKIWRFRLPYGNRCIAVMLEGLNVAVVVLVGSHDEIYKAATDMEKAIAAKMRSIPDDQ